MQDSVFPLV